MTTRRCLATLRSFFTYLRREGLREGNPAEDVEAPKGRTAQTQGAPRPEKSSACWAIAAAAATLFATAQSSELPLYGWSGIRRSAELAGVTLDDIDFGQKVAIVTGKGNKRRIVPLTDASIACPCRRTSA